MVNFWTVDIDDLQSILLLRKGKNGQLIITTLFLNPKLLYILFMTENSPSYFLSSQVKATFCTLYKVKATPFVKAKENSGFHQGFNYKKDTSTG